LKGRPNEDLMTRNFSKDVQPSSPPHQEVQIPQAVGSQPQQQAPGSRPLQAAAAAQPAQFTAKEKLEVNLKYKLFWLFSNTCI